MIGPTLTTERLILRPPEARDFPAWAAMMAQPSVYEQLGGLQPEAAVWRGFAAVTGAWVLSGASMFCAFERSTGRWVGRLGPWFPHGWPGPEVGWAVSPEFQRRGYAKEGATAAIDWVFDSVGWEEVVHIIAPTNRASQAVAQSLGSTLRGPTALPAPYAGTTVELWGQSRAQWRARTSP